MKVKKCIQCKEPIVNQFTSLQKTCSINCQLEYNRANPKKVKTFIQKLEERELRAWRKSAKEKLKTLSDHESEAKKFFQAWIRKRDEDQPCISCGTNKASVWDGGHLFKAELYSGMIFLENNCHKQCGKCNRYLGGNELNYRMGIVVRYGESYMRELEAKKDLLREYKWTREELIGIRDLYKRKLKE